MGSLSGPEPGQQQDGNSTHASDRRPDTAPSHLSRNGTDSVQLPRSGGRSSRRRRCRGMVVPLTTLWRGEHVVGLVHAHGRIRRPCAAAGSEIRMRQTDEHPVMFTQGGLIKVLHKPQHGVVVHTRAQHRHAHKEACGLPQAALEFEVSRQALHGSTGSQGKHRRRLLEQQARLTPGGGIASGRRMKVQQQRGQCAPRVGRGCCAPGRWGHERGPSSATAGLAPPAVTAAGLP